MAEQIPPAPSAEPASSRWAGSFVVHGAQRGGDHYSGCTDLCVLEASVGTAAPLRVAGVAASRDDLRCEWHREDGHVGDEEVRL